VWTEERVGLEWGCGTVGTGIAISVAYLAGDYALSENFIKVHGECASAPAAATTWQPAMRPYP